MATPHPSEHDTLSVKDFGPIARATVELRPLTVFVGASNTGKSYLAMLLYALHRFFGGRSASEGPFSLFGYQQRPPGEATNEQLETTRAWLRTLESRGGQGGLDVVLPEEVAAWVRPVFEDIGDLAPLLDDEVTRCFGVADLRALIRHPSAKDAQVTLHRKLRGGRREWLPNMRYTTTRARTQLSAFIPTDMPLRIEGSALRSGLWRTIRLTDVRDLSPNFADMLATLVLPHIVGTASRPVHYLPAGRAGVMHADPVASSLINSASRVMTGDPSLPVPSGVRVDFLQQLTKLKDAEPGSGTPAELAQSLEANILGGAIGVRRSPGIGYPSFRYRPTDWKNEIALMNTSSMVSELAPVVLYLRHVVGPGDVLIIEEPESHLHPEMQVAFTRFLASVVRSGIRVVVTTHSEWVLETLANLVLLSEVEESHRKEVAGDDLALTRDQVGVWLFEREERPIGSVVKEIPLDASSGTFPAGFNELTEELYNNWAEIANHVAKQAP